MRRRYFSGALLGLSWLILGVVYSFPLWIGWVVPDFAGLEFFVEPEAYAWMRA